MLIEYFVVLNGSWFDTEYSEWLNIHYSKNWDLILTTLWGSNDCPDKMNLFWIYRFFCAIAGDRWIPLVFFFFERLLFAGFLFMRWPIAEDRITQYYNKLNIFQICQGNFGSKFMVP